MMPDPCPFCGYPAGLDFVHGHYQCKACKQNVIPCCNGETCDISGTLENFPETEPETGKNQNLTYPQSFVENPDPDVED